MQLTVIRKIALALGAVLLFGLLPMVVIFNGLRDIEDRLRQVNDVKQPTNAAAYEMEINTIGSGMAVLKYLDTGEAKYREWLAKDEADLEKFKGQYDRLVGTEMGKELGRKFAVLYNEFKTIGKILMDQRDEQELIFGQIGEEFETLDEIIDDKLQANIDRRGADGSKKAILAGEIEVNIAEVGTWLGNYLRTSKKPYKERILDNADDFREELGQFKKLKLTESEKRWTIEIEKVFERTAALIGRVLVVHDSRQKSLDKFLALRTKMNDLLDDQIQLATMQDLHESKKQAADASADAVQMTALFVPLFILSSIGAALLITRSIKKPLKELMDGTQAVAAGDLTYRLAPRCRDEFADLAENFNWMVAQLEITTVSKDRLEASEKKCQLAYDNLSRDMAARKLLEERLSQSEERFRSMVEAVREYAIFMLDPEGRVITWNKGAERVKGYQSEEIIGKHFSCFYPVEDRQRGKPERVLKMALAEGHCEDEGWRVRKDGSKFWASVVVTPVYGGAERLIGFSKVTRDLTGRSQVEEQLKLAKEEAEAASAAKSNFLANISHEIRTPMTGIIGMAGLLGDTELSSTQREYCEIIKRSGESLLTVINEVLDFSKVESGNLELEIIDFELRSAVEEVMDLFAMQAEDKGVELINFIRNDVPTELQGDPGRLRQILANLVGNALKFTTEGEVVAGVSILEQTSTHATLRFSVTDSGIGIPQEKLSKLFHAFTQVDASTTRKYGGTGLGLSICKKFVELMGGKIGVDSQQEKGSCFWFTLQLAKQPEGSRQRPRPRADLRGLSMLIVEGNSTNRIVLEHYLSSFGIKSQSANDGASALELLRVAAEKGEPYDLAILDFMLPGMDGLELARTIRQTPNFAALKLLMLTSVGRRGDGKLAEQAGIDAYLTKPFRFSYLYECLALLMGRAPPKTGSSSALITTHSLNELKAKDRLRILVAEDNHINQKVTVSLLEKLGHRADVVGTGKEAVEAYRFIPYDLVLMDLQMPEMDGFEASLQIRTLARMENRQTSLIAVTAHAMKEYREKCLEWGFDDYVCKPIMPKELRAAMERTMAKAKTIISDNTPADPPAYAAVLNFSEALAQVEGNTELLGEITQIFLEQYPKLLEKTRQALARSESEILAGAAHTLASSVGQLGARRAFSAAKKLEELGWQGDLSRVPEALAELEGELVAVKSALSNHADLSRYAQVSQNE